MSNIEISIKIHLSKSFIYRTEWWKRAVFDFLFQMDFTKANKMYRNFSALEIASHLIQNYPIFTKKTHHFWVPIVMGKRKRIILMHWYSSIQQNLKYIRFESTKVLHINFQKSVHVPSVNESSIFEILNIPCNLRIIGFWYLELYGQFGKIKHHTWTIWHFSPS